MVVVVAVVAALVAEVARAMLLETESMLELAVMESGPIEAAATAASKANPAPLFHGWRLRVGAPYEASIIPSWMLALSEKQLG